MGKFRNRQTVEILVAKPTAAIKITDVGFQVERGYPSTQLYADDKVLVEVRQPQRAINSVSKSVDSLQLNRIAPIGDFNLMLRLVFQKAQLEIDDGGFFYANLIEQRLLSLKLDERDVSTKVLGGLSTFRSCASRGSGVEKLEV